MSSKETHSKIPRKNPIHPFAPVNSSTDIIPPSTRRYVPSSCHGHQQEWSKAHQQKLKKTSGSRSVELDNHRPDDDNEAIRLSLLKFEEDHQKMKLLLESSVKDAEERLEYMRILVEKKNADNTKQQNEETHLQKDIDGSPVPEKEDQNEEEEVTEKRQKITKAKLKAMKEKLHEMNCKTQTYLDDVQGMKKDLEELEDISRRLAIDREDDSETEEEEEKPQKLQNSNENNANSMFITELRN